MYENIMKLFKSFVLLLTFLFVSCVHTKQMSRFVEGGRAPAAPSPIQEVNPKVQVRPGVTQLPTPLNAPGSPHMMHYAQNKVASLSQNLIDDIFPKQATIERIVFEFKDEFPGPNKETDMAILYNAIINNPEIQQFITLRNAVSVYNFIKEALS